MTDRRPTSRLMPSADTFGPLGRIVCTLLVVFPEWLMFQTPWFFTILGRIVYPVLIVVFLRAIWAPVRLGKPSDHPAPPIVPPDWQQQPQDPVIGRRAAPPRW